VSFGRILYCCGILLTLLTGALAAQERPRSKPVLIREDRTSEPETEPEIIYPDPVEARRNLDVGDFYFKKGNFKAAADRYRDAIKYGPTAAEHYSRLIRALEKLEAFDEAVEVCRDYIDKNPESKKVSEFEKKVLELAGKIKG